MASRQKLILFLAALPVLCHGQSVQGSLSVDSVAKEIEQYYYYDEGSLKAYMQPYLDQVRQSEQYDIWLYLLTELINNQFGTSKTADFDHWLAEADSLIKCCHNALFRLDTDSAIYFNFMAGKADHFYDIEKYHQAIPLYKMLLGKASSANATDSIYAAIMYSHLGNAYLSVSNPNRALFYYQRYLSFLPATMSEYYGADEALFYELLGWVYLGGCWYNKAFDNRSEVYYNRAITSYHRALALIDKLEDPDKFLNTILSAYYGLISLHQDYQMYDSAVQYLDGVKRYDGGNDERQSRILFLQGKQETKEGDFDKALESFTSAAELHYQQKGRGHFGVYDVLNHIALTYSDKKEYQRALELVQQNLFNLTDGRQWSELTDNPKVDQIVYLSESLRALRAKAVILREYFRSTNKREYLEASIKTYKLCVEVSLRERKTRVGNQAKQQYIYTHRMLISEALGTCVEGREVLASHMPEEYAFWFMEQGKSLLLQESLQWDHVMNVLNVPVRLVTILDSLRERHTIISQQIRNTTWEDSVAMHFGEIKNAEDQYDSIEGIILDWHPKYYALTQRYPEVSLEAYRSEMSDQDNLLSYFQGDSSWYLLATDQKTSRLVRIDDAGEIAQDIKEILTVLRNARRGSDSLFAYRLNRLYRKLVEPARDILVSGEKLTIFPDGPLNYLPFDLLLSEMPGNAPYTRWPFLILDHPLSYDYSLGLRTMFSDFHHSAERRYLGIAPGYSVSSSKDLMVLQNDSLHLLAERDLGELIYNQEEVIKARALFGGSVLLGDSATKNNFLQEVENVSILHLSMHAYVDEQNFDHSGLVFADFDLKGRLILGKSGFLSLSELAGLKLDAEMVLLSACETAYGYLERGEGIVSLGRAFKMAGCPTIAMSIWKANDYGTSRIMGYFTRSLANGIPKDRALQMAKLKYLEDADVNTAHPYYWAAFILHGNPEPLVFTRANFTWTWKVAIVLIFLLLMGGLYVFRRILKKI